MDYGEQFVAGVVRLPGVEKWNALCKGVLREAVHGHVGGVYRGAATARGEGALQVVHAFSASREPAGVGLLLLP